MRRFLLIASIPAILLILASVLASACPEMGEGEELTGVIDNPPDSVYVSTGVTLTAEQGQVDEDTEGGVPVDDQVIFHWDFGDGHTIDRWGYEGGNQVTHSWATCGVKTVVLWVEDAAEYWDDEAATSTTTIQVTLNPGAPDPVTDFKAIPGNGQTVLTWTNPGGTFTGTKIVYKTTEYPTGPGDGDVAYDGPDTTYTHTGLTNGVSYYYTAFAHNATPSYSEGAEADQYEIFCVNHNAPTGQNGTSWDDAFDEVNDALSLATSGYEVHVAGASAPGLTYSEKIVLIEGVSIRGGYLGEGTERNAETYITILDGDGLEDSVVYCGSGITSSTILDGFTITGGIGHGTGSARNGGGVYCAAGSSPTISHNTIKGNTVARMGGGIYCAGSPTITNNIITDNSAAWMGGGIMLSGGAAEVSCNSIYGNETTSSTFDNNGGGGIYSSASSALIVNNTITGNTAPGKGGGIFVYSSSYPTIVNNTIVGNKVSGTTYGGGIHIYPYGSGKLINNIVAFNSLGIYKASVSNITFTNNDVYGNTHGQYSWVPPSDPPASDISEPPRFVDEGSWPVTEWVEGDWDYHLRILPDPSACIDAGSSGDDVPETDKDNISRPFGAAVDIGAYEHNDNTLPTPGTASSPQYTDSSPITVTYTGASDAGSGLSKVELWYKKGIDGTWTDSTFTQTGASGSFPFSSMTGPGTYYFDLVAEDKAGNRSEEPEPESLGDCSTMYTFELEECSISAILIPGE